MKKCPFCAEDIQNAAIKCKHCEEMLNAVSEVPQQAPVVETGSSSFITDWMAQKSATKQASSIHTGGGSPAVMPEKAKDTTVDAMPQSGFTPKAAHVPEQSPVVQPGGGSPVVLETVQVTDKGGLGKTAGVSPSSQQEVKPTPNAASGCVGCMGLLVLSLFLMMNVFSCSPSQQTTVVGNGPPGLVDAAGRIYPGIKLYTSTGVLFGTVTLDSTRDASGDECVGVRLTSGAPFLLKRASIRQGKTWFTNP